MHEDHALVHEGRGLPNSHLSWAAMIQLPSWFGGGWKPSRWFGGFGEWFPICPLQEPGVQIPNQQIQGNLNDFSGPTSVAHIDTNSAIFCRTVINSLKAGNYLECTAHISLTLAVSLIDIL